MPPHLIKREVPAAGNPDDRRARKAVLDSLDLFEELDERVQRVQEYAAPDEAYRVHATGDENAIRQRAGKPTSRLAAVRRLMHLDGTGQPGQRAVASPDAPLPGSPASPDDAPEPPASTDSSSARKRRT